MEKGLSHPPLYLRETIDCLAGEGGGLMTSEQPPSVEADPGSREVHMRSRGCGVGVGLSSYKLIREATNRWELEEF